MRPGSLLRLIDNRNCGWDFPAPCPLVPRDLVAPSVIFPRKTPEKAEKLHKPGREVEVRN